MTAFVTVAQVRDYLAVSKTDGQYSEGNIGSNIRAASGFLQRATRRQFEPQSATTKVFTTEGRAFMTIPDLRTASSVTLEGSAQTADSTYYLIPDTKHSGVYTGIQFRAFDGPALRGSEWWDRGFDLPDYQRRVSRYGSLPNDLSITGEWGWSDYPESLLHATKILAGWYTRRPDSLLSDVTLTPEGGFLRYSSLPVEVKEFIEEWRLGESVTVA